MLLLRGHRVDLFDGLLNALRFRRDQMRHAVRVLLRMHDVAKVVELLFLGRHIDDLQVLLEHQVVVHSFSGNLAHFGHLELDERVPIRFARSLRSRHTRPRHLAELLKVRLQLFLVKTVRNVLDENDATIGLGRIESVFVVQFFCGDRFLQL